MQLYIYLVKIENLIYKKKIYYEIRTKLLNLILITTNKIHDENLKLKQGKEKTYETLVRLPNM